MKPDEVALDFTWRRILSIGEGRQNALKKKVVDGVGETQREKQSKTWLRIRLTSQVDVNPGSITSSFILTCQYERNTNL